MVKVANIIIKLNLYNAPLLLRWGMSTNQAFYSGDSASLYRPQHLRNASRIPPAFGTYTCSSTSARSRAWCSSFQRSCNAPSVVFGGVRRQGRCNDPHKSSMEAHSSREGSRPAAKRDGRRSSSQRASRLMARPVASRGTDGLRVRSTESERGEATERSSKTP